MNITEDSDHLWYYAMSIDKELPIKGLKCLLKIRVISSLPLDMAQHSRRLDIQQHCCGNLKFSIMLLIIMTKEILNVPNLLYGFHQTDFSFRHQLLHVQ
jgi:hypothetical protein